MTRPATPGRLVRRASLLLIVSIIATPCDLFAQEVVEEESESVVVDAAAAPAAPVTPTISPRRPTVVPHDVEGEPITVKVGKGRPSKVRRPRGEAEEQSPIFQGPQRTGFFAFIKLGAGYHRTSRKNFCLKEWDKEQCPMNTRSSFGYDGGIGVGYRFLPGVAATIILHLGSFKPSNRNERVETSTKSTNNSKNQAEKGKTNNVKYFTHIKYLGVEGSLKVYPFLLMGRPASILSQGFYVEGGGGYAFTDYGNPTKPKLYSTQEGIVRGGVGFDYPLRPDLYLGVQTDAGYFFAPSDEWLFDLNGTLTYFF